MTADTTGATAAPSHLGLALRARLQAPTAGDRSANRPELVVLCGSTKRFTTQMHEIDVLLTWNGYAVYAPTRCDLSRPHPLWANPADKEAGAQRLATVHADMIRRCDWVLVVGDYAGTSTRGEIDQARDLRRPVWFTSQVLAAEFGGDVWQPPTPTTLVPDTAATITFDQGTTARLTAWTAEAFGDEFVLTGHLAPAPAWPTIGDHVQIRRLELPGRGVLADITARVTLSSQRDRIVLTVGFDTALLGTV